MMSVFLERCSPYCHNANDDAVAVKCEMASMSKTDTGTGIVSPSDGIATEQRARMHTCLCPNTPNPLPL